MREIEHPTAVGPREPAGREGRPFRIVLPGAPRRLRSAHERAYLQAMRAADLAVWEAWSARGRR